MKINYLFGMLLLSASAIGQIPTNGLVAFYKFSGNANDNSSNNNNGIVTGATLTSDRFGNLNSAYYFDGSNATPNYIEVQNSNTLNFGRGEFSIACWIQTSFANSQMIIHKGNGFDDPQYYLRLHDSPNNDILLNTSPGGVPNENPSQNTVVPTVSNGNWHFIVAERAIDSLKIFYDGAKVSSTHVDTVNVNSTFSFFIGVQNWNTGGGALSDYFHGKIDDVRIYNRSLTASEVQQLYFDCTTATSIITACGPTSFCSGSNVLLVAPSGNTAYQWTKGGVNIAGATTRSYTATAGGTYRCVVTCGTSTATSNAIALTKLANATVTVSAGGSTSFCAGGNVTLNATNPGAGYSYQWYRGNISINAATSLSYVASNPGSYKIITKNTSNSCSRISTTITTVVNCRLENPTAISGSVGQENNLTIYPNPTNGSFTVELNEIENIEGNAVIELMNTLGQNVYQTSVKVEMGQMQKEIIFSDQIKNGLYILKMIIGNKIYESKMMIN